ncbi:hypothetical protein CK489_11675 [Bradyrhizobium sp. UFLA03-84]|uniref:LysR family transcriptional regulator n=1 Tax=Bradyrhizobium sp. UFLA03-84 TaxID=418599 RepID=UPI000BAE44E0|nr:LysR family transcriptional regulator [Bradyrhizobium sp. UFLA03-84]PAY09083.1 hypothetical protein CK489_11675 [Bradyrhizobium sp. UFLA03-84]
MDLRQLRTFVVVAEAGGFAAAQQQLRLSQPAASRQIQGLEDELGIPLFDRVGRGIKLTSEGEDLLRRGRRLLQDVESFGERARALRTGHAGALRVGCSTQHMETVLANFLPSFRRKHPSVVIELVEDGGARVPDRLQRGDVHLAIIPAADDGYHRRLLAPVHVLAAVSPRHGFASRRKLEIAELAEESLLLLRRDFASRGWFDAACNIAHVRPRVILESAAPHTLLALARGGNDVAIVPSNVQIPASVHALPLLHRGASIGRWTAVAWDPQRFLAPYAKSFIDELVAYCGKHYPGRKFAKHVSPLPRPEETKG